jgi:small GTP-binding protein
MYYKIALLGAGGVGKSDLTLRFTQDRFVEDYDPTIEDQYTKTFELEGRAVKLEILDTAGQEEFWHMTDFYIKQREAFILVYSIADQGSFDTIKHFASKILENINDECPIVIIGNKVDLKDCRVVNQSCDEVLNQFKYSAWIETSAKNNENVFEAFNLLVKLIWKRNLDRNQEIGFSDIVIETPLPEPKSKQKKCCKLF